MMFVAGGWNHGWPRASAKSQTHCCEQLKQPTWRNVSPNWKEKANGFEETNREIGNPAAAGRSEQVPERLRVRRRDDGRRVERHLCQRISAELSAKAGCTARLRVARREVAGQLPPQP